jgi:hypothetical protein
VSIAADELALYEGIWQQPAYHRHSPGQQAIPRFIRLVGQDASSLDAAGQRASVADFGCGTGRASLVLARHGFRVVATDQTDAGLEIMPVCEPGVNLRFVRHCLWQSWPERPVDFGFCCDVLEHVPTELTGLALTRMLEACVIALYVEVSTEPDQMGVLAGQPLHKTVRPFTWWRDLCAEVGKVEYGIDLASRAAFVVR